MTQLDALQRQLDAMNAAAQSNVLSVRYGNGEQVTYRSAADLQQAITDVQRRMNELRRVNAGVPRHGISAARFTTP
jgi:hypothetical protein